MTAPPLRIDPRETTAGAVVAATAVPGDADTVIHAPVDARALAGLPGTVGRLRAGGSHVRVVVDVTHDDPVDEVVAAVWALGCGAQVRTGRPGDVSAAASVLPPDGRGVHPW